MPIINDYESTLPSILVHVKAEVSDEGFRFQVSEYNAKPQVRDLPYAQSEQQNPKNLKPKTKTLTPDI